MGEAWGGIVNSRVVRRVAALGVPVVALSGALLLMRGGETPSTAAVEPEPTVSPTPGKKCSTAKTPFVPTSISIAGIPKITVLPLARDSYNVPGTPPLTNSGKNAMAFDLGSKILIGASKGNALLNAHTYPDGSALGNKLLKELEKGDSIIVKGALGQTCYKVTDEEEVPFDDPGTRYYAKKGKPQIAIIVCSGERIGPGQWTKRTIWYASPVA
jgi:hypothetical protein